MVRYEVNAVMPFTSLPTIAPDKASKLSDSQRKVKTPNNLQLAMTFEDAAVNLHQGRQLARIDVEQLFFAF